MKTRNYRYYFFLLICSYFVVGVLRSPDVLLSGRFWAEEGTVFWLNANTASLFGQISFIPEWYGYAPLVTNLQMLLAVQFPVTVQPLVTSWTSLAIAAAGPITVLFSPLRIELKPPGRFVLSALLMFSSAVTEPEVFANSINVQVYLGVFLVILFLVDWNDLGTGALFTILISSIVAILSSPYAVSAGLVFSVYLAIQFHHHKVRRNRALVILASTIIPVALQLIVQARSKLIGTDWVARSNHSIGLAEMYAFLASNFATVFLTREISDFVYLRVLSQLSIKGEVIVTLMVVAFFVSVVIRRHDKVSSSAISSVIMWVLVAHLGISVTVLVGYADAVPHSRYQVTTSALLIVELFLLGNCFKPLLPKILVFLLLPAAIIGFQDDSRGFLTCRKPCADWRTQVSQQDPENFVFFWPDGTTETQWKIRNPIGD